MAVTAHWIYSCTVETVSGPQQKLEIKAALIGFLKVPGRHTGEHLAQCFMHVLDRYEISEKVYFILFQC